MHLKRQILALLLAGLGTLVPQAGWASAFTVNPTQVVLSTRQPSALLVLGNESSVTLRFQLTVFKWDQSAQGEMLLSPTQDIVYFPSLFSLAPKERRRVRIGVATDFAAAEKTYRIFVEELPPRPGEEGPDQPGGVRVLTKMGIPIFLQPAKTLARATLQEPAVNRGSFSFRVRNTGNVHFVAQAIRVRGFTAAGDQLFEHGVNGWYILAGGWRVYTVELPRQRCAEVASLGVEVQVDQASLKERLETPAGVCPP